MSPLRVQRPADRKNCSIPRAQDQGLYPCRCHGIVTAEQENRFSGGSRLCAALSHRVCRLRTIRGLPARQQMARQMVPYGNNQAPNTNSRALNGTIHAVRFASGYFFCFVLKDAWGTSDSLFVSSPDAGQIARQQENIGIPKYPILCGRI